MVWILITKYNAMPNITNECKKVESNYATMLHRY
jgi:hypothetical protein